MFLLVLHAFTFFIFSISLIILQNLHSTHFLFGISIWMSFRHLLTYFCFYSSSQFIYSLIIIVQIFHIIHHFFFFSLNTAHNNWFLVNQKIEHYQISLITLNITMKISSILCISPRVYHILPLNNNAPSRWTLTNKMVRGNKANIWKTKDQYAKLLSCSTI